MSLCTAYQLIRDLLHSEYACDPRPWPFNRRWGEHFPVRASPQGPAEAHRVVSVASAQRPWRRGLRSRLSRLPPPLSDYSIHRLPECAVGKLLTTWLCSGDHGVTSEMRSLCPRSSEPKRGLAWCLIMAMQWDAYKRSLQAFQILKDLNISSSIPTNLSRPLRYLQKNRCLWTIWWRPFPL